ncbi:MAG: CoA transferase [Armatimonadetes bacterium]|nr:CoA transferase [Armatimonadota bacterium]
MELPVPYPLEDVRVLDLTRVLAGPYCTMMLGDLGADVIKVERPGSGDDVRAWGPPFAPGGESAYFLCVNRNKRSITIDLKAPEGLGLVYELARRSDILVENFKTGTLDGMGLGYDALHEINPCLIYCSITGFGSTGPYSDLPGYDLIVQAMGGIMSITGEAEGAPAKGGVPIVDITTGMFSATAILAALRVKEKTGKGQRIDMALLDSEIAWLGNVAGNCLVSGKPARRLGNAHPNITPYEVYPTSDGYVALAIGNERQWRRFCRVSDAPHLAEEPVFQTNADRVRNREKLVPLMTELMKGRTAQEWIALLRKEEIPCGPIQRVDQVLNDPQVRARGMVVEAAHPTAGLIELVGSPLKLADTPPEVRLPPPTLGQHTEGVLREVLGLSEAAIGELRARGVICFQDPKNS